MTREFRTAVVGATGLVGSELIEAIRNRRFPFSSVKLYASVSGAGEELEVLGDGVNVEPISADFFQDVEIVFFCAPAMVSRDLAESAAQAGCLVIDASSAFRLAPQVPLVVAEVNPEAMAGVKRGRIVASPSAPAVALSLVLSPLHRRFGVRGLNAVTIHGSTAAGRAGFEELHHQTIDIFNQNEFTPERFPRQSAFNVFPRVGGFTGADSEAELALIRELPKILDAEFKLAVTAVQAPYFCGLAMALSFELGTAATPEEVRAELSRAAGLKVLDDPEEETYPDTLEAMACDEVTVGRIRPDPSRERGLQLWLAMDNLRRGASLNLLQIARLAMKDWE